MTTPVEPFWPAPDPVEAAPQPVLGVVLPKEPPVRSGVLLEAEALINGERDGDYGSPTDNFTRIAAIWNVLFERKLSPGEQFTAHNVADAFIATKLARTIAKPTRDNYVDIAGYAGCGWECAVAE